MADVGDRDEQAEAVFVADSDRLAVHRIVEVARVFAVDGDQRHVAQVDPFFEVGVAHFSGQLGGRFERRRREDVRHAELAHGDFDFHARVVEVAQHFDDAPGRLLEARRLVDQFDADDLAGLGIAGRTGNQHVLADALVFRGDQPDAVFVEQAADDMAVGARDDFDDGRFLAAAAVGAGHFRHHAVAVQHFLHLFVGQKQVFARLVGDDEAKAVAMGADLAGDETGMIGQFEHAGLIRVDLAVALHRVQAARQHFHGVRVDIKGARQCCRVKRGLCIAENAENFLAAGNGMSRLVQIVFSNCIGSAPGMTPG